MVALEGMAVEYERDTHVETRRARWVAEGRVQGLGRGFELEGSWVTGSAFRV